MEFFPAALPLYGRSHLGDTVSMSAYDSELARLVAELNRSAARAPRADDKATAAPPYLDQLLTVAAQEHASDVLLVANSPIAFRMNGALTTASNTLTSSDEVRGYLQPVLTSPLAEELEKHRSIDFCFMRPNIGRFRANVHYQRGTLAAAIRLLPAQIPSLESLHLPAILASLAERRQGFVLTGPTGSGKLPLWPRSSISLIFAVAITSSPSRIPSSTNTHRSSIVEQVEVGRCARFCPGRALRSASES